MQETIIPTTSVVLCQSGLSPDTLQISKKNPEKTKKLSPSSN